MGTTADLVASERAAPSAYGCMKDPFSIPRPRLTYVSRWGDEAGTVKHRTVEQAREVMLRRIQRWYAKRLDAVPDGATRAARMAEVFENDGWAALASICDNTTATQPMHGNLFTHPEKGILIYADKPRDGDLGPDFIALPPAGPFNRSLLAWGADLTDLMDEYVLQPVTGDVRRNGPNPYPHQRVKENLISYAYRTATPQDRKTASFLLAMTGRTADGFLVSDLSVTPA